MLNSIPVSSFVGTSHLTLSGNSALVATREATGSMPKARTRADVVCTSRTRMLSSVRLVRIAAVRARQSAMRTSQSAVRSSQADVGAADRLSTTAANLRTTCGRD